MDHPFSHHFQTDSNALPRSSCFRPVQIIEESSNRAPPLPASCKPCAKHRAKPKGKEDGQKDDFFDHQYKQSGQAFHNFGKMIAEINQSVLECPCSFLHPLRVVGNLASDLPQKIGQNRQGLFIPNCWFRKRRGLGFKLRPCQFPDLCQLPCLLLDAWIKILMIKLGTEKAQHRGGYTKE